MKELRGKNAVLTGASRGLGVYIAKTLAARGVNLALAARSADALEETRRICETAGVRAIAIPCDVGIVDDQRRLLATTERELGSIDIVINNAAIEYTEETTNLSFEQIDDLLRINLSAPIWMTKLVLPAMRKRGSGAIVNVASLAGKSPSPYSALYGASKAGLISFTNSTAVELDGSGVTLGVVCPSFVADSGMWARHEDGGVAKTPRLVRAVSPQKVADAVARAIERGGEILVAAGPIRPLFAFGEMVPSARGGLVKRLGVREMSRREAERLKQGADRVESTPDRATTPT